ncbi:flagellar hook-associated protein FlgK [bacterium]|nr:flagellar hook-associated protein FlgK [bacterium]
MYSINTRGSQGLNLSAQLAMARDALLSHQNSLNTISHNVANVDTLGYHRQRTVLGARAGLPGINGTYGQGVEVLGIQRAQVEYISRQERSDSSLVGRWTGQRDSMRRVEETLNELGDYGIGTALDNFWNSWEDLANDADNASARTAVITAAKDLGYSMATTYSSMDSQREQINTEMMSQAGSINLYAARIANLNEQIADLVASGQVPNDLLDARELLLKDLSSLVNIHVEYEGTGAANVYIGSEEIVHRDSYRELAWQGVGDGSLGKNGGNFVWSDNGNEVSISSGYIYGMLQTRDEIGDILAELDTLADAVRSTVNAAHIEGIGHDGTTGNVFFRDDVTGARSLEVDEEILENVDKVAASRLSATGANDLAHDMYELQFANPWGDSRTINSRYATMVSDIGTVVQNADLRYETSEAALQQTENLQQEYTGVNLDEEMSAMINTQYAYNAASKVFNTVEEMMDRVVNGLT